jgi:hypothetical protein
MRLDGRIRMNAGTTLLALLAGLAAAAPAAAPAAPASADPAGAATATKANAYGPMDQRLVLPGNVDRRIGAHVFTPSLLIRAPFAVTQVGADLLYGSGTATGPKPSILDLDRGEATYTFAAMGQTFYYDHKVSDALSVGGGLIVSLYSGIDGPSAVVLGLQVGAGLFGRLTWGREIGPMRAAFTFDAAYAPRYGLLILDAIANAADPAASAFKDTNAWTLKPGFSVAFAPHPALGLTLSADYQGVAFDTNDAGWQYESGIDAGLALDLDVGTFTKAPIAVVGAFRVTAPFGSGDAISTVIDYTAGVFYTGRPPLVLGMELGQRYFTFRTSAGDYDAVANIVQLRVQYLW